MKNVFFAYDFYGKFYEDFADLFRFEIAALCEEKKIRYYRVHFLCTAHYTMVNNRVDSDWILGLKSKHKKFSEILIKFPSIW